MDAAFSIRIEGRVQGVGFRAWTLGEAGRLGLRGWVCNEADGSVSALLAGDARALRDLIERLRVGPRASKVTAVDARPTEPEDVPAGLSVRR